MPPTAPPSNTIDVRFPLPQFNREYAAQGGNPQPIAGRLLIYVPAGFDARRTWPLLIVNSTTDGGRTSVMDAPGYRGATADGWVVLASEANIRLRSDTISWRAAVLSAGLDVLHRDWPASKGWPVVFAGLSGGAKCSEWMSAIFAPTHSLRIAGIFLAGINDDRMPAAVQAFHPPPEFHNTPIWISSGRTDGIARPDAEREVQGSLIHLGFRNVRMSSFLGGHELDRADLRNALRWFRSVGKF
ncbi:MAG: hypothetical protein ACJ8LI_04185 [Chthoniobacterales bacterium]